MEKTGQTPSFCSTFRPSSHFYWALFYLILKLSRDLNIISVIKKLEQRARANSIKLYAEKFTFTIVPLLNKISQLVILSWIEVSSSQESKRQTDRVIYKKDGLGYKLFSLEAFWACDLKEKAAGDPTAKRRGHDSLKLRFCNAAELVLSWISTMTSTFGVFSWRNRGRPSSNWKNGANLTWLIRSTFAPFLLTDTVADFPSQFFLQRFWVLISYNPVQYSKQNKNPL